MGSSLASSPLPRLLPAEEIDRLHLPIHRRHGICVVEFFSSLLMCNLGSCRHQFLGIWRPEYILAILQNFREAPAYDAPPVDQELTDKLP